MLYILHI